MPRLHDDAIVSRLAAMALAAVVVVGAAGCDADDGADGGSGGTPGPGDTPPAASPTPPDPRQVNLQSGTVTLPEWPAPRLREQCPAGTSTFTDGEATAAEGWSYYVSFLDEPLYADLDGQPGEEILTTVGCGPPQAEASVAVLGLRVADGGRLDTMAYVQGDASFFETVSDVRVDGRIVALETRRGLGPDEPRHTRTFRWEGDRFAQVAGPTAAPS